VDAALWRSPRRPWSRCRRSPWPPTRTRTERPAGHGHASADRRVHDLRRTESNSQRSHPDTLVVVTADHGHTSQIVEAATLGYTATLVTADNATMTVSYATSEITGSQQHTGTEVRIAAGGPQAANVLGVTNQTDLFFTMKRALGLR
jgi:alkaline phosphatase